jgi:anti-sigma-K factor RskA
MSGVEQLPEHMIDLIPAFVLDALDEGEARQVSRHLQSCPECAAEHRSYLQVMESLPLAAPGVNPPPRLRGAILQAARRQLQPRPSPARLPWFKGITEIFQKRSVVWMAASLGMILILAAGNLYQWRSSSQPAPQVPEYHFDVIAMAPDAPGTPAEGVLVISPDGRYGTLVVDGLEPLVSGQEYQLWLILGESRVSGGLFIVGASGYGAMEVEAPRPLSEYSQFGITIEPVGGSAQPTGDRVLQGQL